MLHYFAGNIYGFAGNIKSVLSRFKYLKKLGRIGKKTSILMNIG